MSSSEGGMSLGVGDLGGRHRPLPADQRVDHGGSQLRDEPLEQRARVEVGQRRSSMTVLEMSGPEILTARMRFSGFRVGSVRRQYRVRPFLSSLTPTVAMMSPCSYSSYLPKASIARWCSRKCGATRMRQRSAG